MTDNSSHSYTYYSFPPTPNRNSPQSARSRSIDSTFEDISQADSAQLHQSGSYYRVDMPSPAARSEAPRTPTKLGRKPQSSAPKLNKPTDKPTDKPEDTAQDAEKQSEGLAEKTEEKVSDAKDKVEDTAKSTKNKVDDTADSAKDEAQDTLEDTTSKSSQKSDDLAYAEPKPIDDDKADDTDATEETADDATQKAGDEIEDNTEDDATDTASKDADSAKKTGEGALSGARGLAGRASSLAGKAKQDPEAAAKQAGSHVEETAEDAEESAKDATKDAKDTAEDTAESTKDATEDTAESAKDAAEDTTKSAEDTAEDAKDDAEVAGEDAKNFATDATDDAKDMADDAKDGAEETTGQDLPDSPDLSVLTGLEVDESGIITDKEGKKVGRLVEGDAEDLAGYPIGDGGEILDDDGDLVGRCELLPEVAEEHLKAAKDDRESKKPSLSLLKGLTADRSGQILTAGGDFIGHLVEGDPAEIQGKEFNERGEIQDDQGNVIARAELTEEAAERASDDEEHEEDEDSQSLVDDIAAKADEATDDVEKTGEEAKKGAKDAADDVEDELPGVEALEGMDITSHGEILNEAGEVVGNVAEGDLENIEGAKGLTVNDKGEVVDADGKVLGQVELAEGATEKLKDSAAGALDVRILEGLKVNKKGKILDADGEEIGELNEGELKDCAGKKVNEKGEVIDKNGEVIGKVNVVAGEAAFEAIKELKERLGEETKETQEVEVMPDLDVLEGLKVNKKGQVLDEDGEPIGELVEGEIKDCAGKKINDKGEVLDKDGKVIGKVKTLPQTTEQQVGEADDAAQNAEDAAEDAAENAENVVEDAAENAEDTAKDTQDTANDAEDAAEDDRPPLSILDGLKVNKAGKLIDGNGNIVGELTEGDAKKLWKTGTTCDAEGQFWNNKGKIVGRAQTIAQEDGEEETPFAGLEGLTVVKDGFVEDKNGNRVGKVVEGDAKKLISRAVDEDGDIVDKKGSVVGHAERYEEPEEEQESEAEPEDLSILAGKTVNKAGNVIGDESVPIGRLVEGNAKELAGKKIDSEGKLWNDSGKVIGRCELIPEEERENKPEGLFAGLQGLRVIADGKVADDDGNIVGTVVEGNAKRLIGMAVDEDGDILNKYGDVKGHAEPVEEEEEAQPDDLSVLDRLKLNKQGFLVNSDGIPVGRLVEGNLKDLAGRKSDGEGKIYNDTGKVVGKCELIPENERVTKQEGPFAGYEGLRVVKDGFVEDNDGNRVGQISEGDKKKLVGHSVDEDGDIIDKYGNVKGHAEPWSEEEAVEEDLSSLKGCTVNKGGNIVDSSGAIIGRVAEGDVKSMIGKKVDGKGQIWDNEGNVIGRAELVHGHSSGPEGPFAGFDGVTVAKDGTVQTPDGTIIGRVTEGDVKKLIGHKVDEDGEISDRSGNTIGKAERWEPEEKERRANPMAGMRVNKEGEVRDQDGDVIGRLTAGDLGHCSGLEIDDNGYVVDNDGNKVGEVTLLENIHEEEEEEEEDPQKKSDAELADKMSNICQQTLDRVQPVMKQITDHIEQADRTPRDELDEEELVNNVKPLIEEASRMLNDCNSSLRALDPDGKIAAQAKGRQASGEATSQEYKLADLLKELTTSVVTTIDNAKKKIADMPHAKKKLNPLWSLLTEPLFQIIAAVGLLLTGVLNLVGKLLNGLGLGGLVNGLLGGLGINKLLGGLGLGGLTDTLGGKKEKKKGGGMSNIPIVGGLLGKK